MDATQFSALIREFSLMLIFLSLMVPVMRRSLS